MEHVLDQRLAIIERGIGRDQDLRRGEPEIEHQQQSEGLADVALADAVLLDKRIGEAPPIEERQRGKHHLAHREQAVIARIEQAHHQESRTPGDDLGDDLAAIAPRQRIAHARSKAGRGRAARQVAGIAVQIPALLWVLVRAIHPQGRRIES